MGVLDDAAEELVKKMLPFSGLLEEARERFDELDGEIEGLQKTVDEEWDSLEEKANAFIARVNEEREKLEKKSDEAVQALADLKSAVDTAEGDLEAEMDGVQDEVKAFTDAVEPLDDDVESLVAGHAEAPGDGLAEQAEALVREIDLELNETKMHLETSVTRGLQTVAVTVDMWAADVLKAASESQARLDRAYQDFAIRLAEGGDLVAAGLFESTRANLDRTVEHAMEECEKAHHAKLDDLQEVIDALKQQLGELATTVEAAENTIETAGESLESALKDLKGEVLGAQKQLDRMEKFLGRYTFTQ